MKMLVLVLSLLGSTAFAEMKPMGTFVASECGKSEQGYICIGKRVAVPGTYISVAVKNTAQTVFAVVKTTPIIGINPYQAVEELDLVAQNGQKAVATMISENGKVILARVQFSGKTVTVNKMEMVFTTAAF